MRLDLCKKLHEAAPSLFGSETFFTVEQVGPGITSWKWFSIQCDDGWFDILLDLCTKLNAYIQTLPDNIGKEIVISQIKEKYGTLRVYLSHYDDVMDKMIEETEEKSAHVCELCGKEGRLRGKVWFYTACDAHTKPYDLVEEPENDNSVS